MIVVGKSMREDLVLFVYCAISDKENDVKQETERIRRQIRVEKQIQQELQQEIASLKAQLEEGRQGLQAATRLGDQLEFTKKQNVALKEEGKSVSIFCRLINRHAFSLTAVGSPNIFNNLFGCT